MDVPYLTSEQQERVTATLVIGALVLSFSALAWSLSIVLFPRLLLILPSLLLSPLLVILPLIAMAVTWRWTSEH